MGALIVKTPQSVPTAPSMHKHTMRVVLDIECLDWEHTRAFPCRLIYITLMLKLDYIIFKSFIY